MTRKEIDPEVIRARAVLVRAWLQGLAALAAAIGGSTGVYGLATHVFF